MARGLVVGKQQGIGGARFSSGQSESKRTLDWSFGSANFHQGKVRARTLKNGCLAGKVAFAQHVAYATVLVQHQEDYSQVPHHAEFPQTCHL